MRLESEGSQELIITCQHLHLIVVVVSHVEVVGAVASNVLRKVELSVIATFATECSLNQLPLTDISL